jgi:Flp pilus assembly pilin Flp
MARPVQCSSRPRFFDQTESEDAMRARVQAGAISRWIDDEQGVTSIEYALLAAMFATIVLGSVVTLKGSLQDMYNMIASVVTAAVDTALGR